jgi:hypothetical protein
MIKVVAQQLQNATDVTYFFFKPLDLIDLRARVMCEFSIYRSASTVFEKIHLYMQ